MIAPADLGRVVDELTPGVIALRRQLHQHPALAFEETWTATTLAARMRALALPETRGREYASWLDNRSHACGHDVHSAVVAGVAEVLARHRDRIAGRVASSSSRRTSPCGVRAA